MRINKREILLIGLALLALCAGSAHGHGVRGGVESGGLVVQAHYDGGEPMSYAKVTISAPEAEIAFQTGRTDRNGRFCFFPDQGGDWKVVADDGMGHRLELVVPVPPQGEGAPAPAPPTQGLQARPTLERAVTGLAIFFGIGGIGLWWREKRRQGRGPSEIPR